MYQWTTHTSLGTQQYNCVLIANSEDCVWGWLSRVRCYLEAHNQRTECFNEWPAFFTYSCPQCVMACLRFDCQIRLLPAFCPALLVRLTWKRIATPPWSSIFYHFTPSLTIYIICIRICTRRGRGINRKWAGHKPEVGVVWSEMGGVISVCYFKPEIDMHWSEVAIFIVFENYLASELRFNVCFW